METVYITSADTHRPLQSEITRRPHRIRMRKNPGKGRSEMGTRETPISLQAGWSSAIGRIHLDWKKQKSAELYRVEYAPLSESPTVWRSIGRTASTHVELQGLTPHSEFWFRVIAIM